MPNVKDEIKNSWMAANISFKFSLSAGTDISEYTQNNNATTISITKDDGDAKDRLRKMHQRWNAVVEKTTMAMSPGSRSDSSQQRQLHFERMSQKWFERIIQMHTEKGRHYHTLCHLEEMFGFLDLTLNHEIQSACRMAYNNAVDLNEDGIVQLGTVVDLSVFFHDCVYDAKSGSNEEDSAIMFQKFAKELLWTIDHDFDYAFDNDYKTATTTDCNGGSTLAASNWGRCRMVWKGCNFVNDFILATKSHSCKDIPMNCVDTYYPRELVLRHLEVFLDADMAVLGKRPEAYDHYASLIRQEYGHVEHDDYCSKRADILESFASSVTPENTSDDNDEKHVYLTQSMRGALEEMAIANLKREVSILRKGIIPGEN
mmetsp:Transcript_401/g.483  ORF Transcript_401/g.483 Transcript_401/m.483 type:complete len:372 (+) Transcript_401:239-1354(+)|eukprot:CAMPEP_0194092158 /NCGR_PEP_ID=MMETSP0149-20130528/45724_1 /TAXON_ID=122233 /ORGANISM="Chaetoceros debilis, Strain MM31A-1" /LENGTH=371 /DNA_ID=CAMNT_0038777001 /DNA_START=124 /DNA_END=1239 /DNA_ORIENTATION=-